MDNKDFIDLMCDYELYKKHSKEIRTTRLFTPAESAGNPAPGFCPSLSPSPSLSFFC